MTARRADFSGSWYPSKEPECRRVIEEFAKTAEPCPPGKGKFVGGIVPHAGWYFSGRVACSVIQCLSSGGGFPETVVIFGRHLHPGGRNYIMKEGRWATPLGDLEIDRELGDQLSSRFSFVVETPSRYDQDNTIELQLPFIKYFFPDAKILPVGAPPVLRSLEIGESVAEIAETVGRRIMVLGSTDLTHYGHNYGFTPMGTGPEAVQWVRNENDKKVVDLMLKMDGRVVIEESLRNYNACCSGAVAAAIAAAKRLGAVEALKLSYTTSYDIRPDSSFVGYVGIVFS
ncbi:MAG: AmmeMemoRadiSam system protein B [Deltaproteobacteria bacterium]|nr:AmmeMemoRadiSam system protein B [Deltaproteobacteria bacterium]